MAYSAQGIDQRLVHLRRTDGDAQELGNSRLFEVTHDHPLLAQARRKLGSIVLRVAGKDEVGR